MDTNPISHEPPSYHQEFQQGVNIFEESFKNYEKSTFQAQKDMYKKAMNESLDAMGKSASALANEQLKSYKDKLAKDLNTYIQDPTKDHSNQVLSDISQMKQS
ncbi:MAG TPA: hypothetical protein PLO43_00405 [Chlamydiales bacterium]|nr:hypothetical protein [Chlamydiales bacterium]HPE84627.1 hypothetical protein [Chlamydiales bacterium]